MAVEKISFRHSSLDELFNYGETKHPFINKHSGQLQNLYVIKNDIIAIGDIEFIESEGK
jgi:hypothetical protein